MFIDGKAIAQSILLKLHDKVTTLTRAGITPTLAVILVGDDAGSLSYIKQKQKAADKIGAKIIFEHLPSSTSRETLAAAIARYNADNTVHGLIVQRPVPIEGVGEIINSVTASKDVDGFIPNSPFEAPVARGVITILGYVHDKIRTAELTHDNFKTWLNAQTIVVIGRGETAGKPIAETLAAYGCAPTIVHSQTPHPKAILKKAAIIVSCVGREKVITKNMISRGVILIGVGLQRDEHNTLQGDYEIDDIKDTASFYTPTPGGVGPVNVACLMQNLVDACIIHTHL